MLSHNDPRSPRRRAFTLIELLVVIAVIAILAAIMFPVFEGIRIKGRLTVCTSNLRQLGVAIGMYVSDYDEKVPTLSGFTGTAACPNDPLGGNGSTRCNNDGFLSHFGWALILQPYVKNGHIFACPAFPPGTFKWDGLRYTTCFPSGWPPREMFPNGISYQYKGSLASFGRAGGAWAGIRAPATTVLLQEFSAPHHFNMNVCGGLQGIQCFDNFTNPALVQKRGEMGVNVCFADGHVKFMRVSQTLFARFNPQASQVVLDTYWVQNKVGTRAASVCFPSDGQDFED